MSTPGSRGDRNQAGGISEGTQRSSLTLTTKKTEQALLSQSEGSPISNEKIMTQNRSSVQAEHSSQYHISIRGHLHNRWAERFEDMEIIHEPDYTTTLIGNVPDQAALYGLIIKLRDMGLTLLAIRKI